MRVLVAGGTGMLGAPVVRHLLAAGHRVRVLTRRPEAARAIGAKVEIAVADVTEPRTLDDAVRQCDALHVSLRGVNNFDSYEAVEHRGLVSLLSSAAKFAVQHVTYLSGAGRVQGNESSLPVRVKLDAEAAVQRSGIPYTIFRATHFMESLDLFMRGQTATIIGHQPHRYRYLAAVDFAALVEHALTRPAARNKTLYAFGPEAYTMREALDVYLRALCPKGRIVNLPLPLARLMGLLTGNPELRFAAELFAGFAKIGESGDAAEADSLLGKPATTLSKWSEARAVGRAGTAHEGSRPHQGGISPHP